MRPSWLIAVACLAGCATSTSARVKPGQAVDPGRAYLYGRFYINAPADEHGFGGKQSVGFGLQCEDGSRYTFGSTDTHDVQVMEIDPGRCWLMRVVFADQYGLPMKTLPVDRKEQRPLDFAAGRAYYLGDYFAKADFWFRSQALTTIEHLEWAVSPGVGDRYATTTADMKRGFPKLAGLPTVAMPLLAPEERKRDNGIAPLPDEPPMSPARAGLVAAFVKRVYRTPAECEAACPAGQCYPYRSEKGAAMVCVIHCDRDADCPQGLACNCPDAEKPAGPGCVPIAATRGDPMARICLAAPAPEAPPVQSTMEP